MGDARGGGYNSSRGVDGELRKQALHHVWRGRLVKLGQSPDGERERERERTGGENGGERELRVTALLGSSNICTLPQQKQQ